MLNIVVEIKAPEIVEVVKTLIASLNSLKAPVMQESIQAPTMHTPEQLTPTPQMQQMPVQQTQPLQIQQPEPIPQPQMQTVQAPIQQPTPQPQPPAAVPTVTQTYTMDQLAVAATQLMDAGRKNDLLSLLASFGVQALTALPKEQYGNFATQLRAMGAKI